MGSAPESSRLSLLPAMLDTDPSFRPLGDVSIDPNDIVLSPDSPKPGEPTLVTLTVRNQGSGDLFKVSVHVAWGAMEDVRGGGTRMVVVDLPARGSAEIKLQTTFPLGHGVISVMAMQLSDHSPFESLTSDPTPEDSCAFRIVNPQLVPARFLASIGEANGCRGK